MKCNLIKTYELVCNYFDKNPQWKFIRLSNNNTPCKFTDQEAVTVYLFVGYYQKYSKIKDIYSFALHYLDDWFPHLTSYAQFNSRLNILYPIFYDITLDIISNNIPKNAQQKVQLIDSLPIVTCKGRNRDAKVARGYVDKGFCSTKNMYYYGLKLHLLAFRRKGTIPFPNKIYFSPASQNDLSVVKELNRLDDLVGTDVFDDSTSSAMDSIRPLYACKRGQRFAKMPQTARFCC